MIVRLKVCSRTRTAVVCSSFNSMIVRLKGSHQTDAIYIQPEFQFYDSPIKSGGFSRFSKNVHEFQFYDSPIKRRHPLFCPYPPRKVSIL